MFKMRNRIAVLLVVLVAIFALVPGTLAQETADPTFGLSEDDFALFSLANGNSFNATSYGYAFDSTINVDLGDGPLAASLAGAGVISPGSISLAVTGDLGGMPVDVELRLIEDSAYITGIDSSGTWYELGQAEAAELQGLLEDELPFDPNALASGDPSELGLSEEAQMEVFSSVFGLLEEIPSLITITSGEAEGLTTFEINVPLGEIVALGNTETVVAAGILSNNSELEFTDAQTQAADVTTTAEQFLSGSTFTYTQFVDTATERVQEGLLNFSLGDSAPVTADITFDVTLDYDADTTVEAPADAVPASELLDALGGM